jgi:hypothetical protein
MLRAIGAVLSSRLVLPIVIGFFFLVYVGIAFGTDETLTALMEFSRHSVFLILLLSLLPLNCALRLLLETRAHLARRRALRGEAAGDAARLFDETVTLPLGGAGPQPEPVPASPQRQAPAGFSGLEARLSAAGYRTHRAGNALAAWRGTSRFPARLALLAGTLCLFAGILISLTTRVSQRTPLIEGEPVPQSAGGGGAVAQLLLTKSSGLFLDKTLAMVLTPADPGEGSRRFGLYPPALYQGAFVYPRYLGIALYCRIAAPDAPAGYEVHCIPNIYPPGKEDNVEIPGSPYRLALSIAPPADASDPFVTGRVILNFKLLKGKDVVLTGSAPGGGEFSGAGYRVSFPEARRLAITDFIRDYGVFLIWASAFLFLFAGCFWLPVRLCWPRRELLFCQQPDAILASSHAEGKRRKHAGVFHESLDYLDVRQS